MDRYETHPAPNRSSASVNAWLLVILLFLVAFLVFRMTDVGRGPLHDPTAQPRPVAARGDLAADEQATIELYRQASSSVVHVTSVALGRDRLNLNLLEIPRGTGSGIVWDEQGYIVTNYHVVQGAQFAKVMLADGSVWDGRMVGDGAPDKDLAVLKIDAPARRLRPILVGSSSDLEVGQKVFAIGNPFGLDQTLTTGVISGLGREILSVTRRPITGVIQTDAAINPGNSGGPLLDSAGRLIGVNTAIYSPSGAYAGIGFAVPVDTLNQIVPQLIRTGRVDRPGMGIVIFEDSLFEQLRQRGVLDRRGVLVRGVMPGSAADEAGFMGTRVAADEEIVWGDLIIAVDGERVENTQDLFRILDERSVGESVEVTLFREGRERTVELTLQALPYNDN